MCVTPAMKHSLCWCVNEAKWLLDRSVFAVGKGSLRVTAAPLSLFLTHNDVHTLNNSDCDILQIVLLVDFLYVEEAAMSRLLL